MASLDKDDIDRIEFGLLSPDEIRRYSVAQIQYTEPLENHLPKVGGLLDLRMGCFEKNVRCATCNQKMTHCPGHFGHIELARPVYHVYFIQNIKKVLECVCLRCARIRVTPDNEEYQRICAIRNHRVRFKQFWKLCKSKEACDYTDCGAQCPQIRMSGGDIILCRPKSRMAMIGDVLEDDNNMPARRTSTPTEVREILSRINDEEASLLGFDPVKARPEWMILTVLPVPPPCVRPSVAMGSGSRGEDDLTVKLCDIIRFNRLLQKNNDMDAMTKSLDEYEPLLQYHVSTYFDNETNLYAKSTQKGGRPVKSMKARISGKNGRIRGNIMGKRVDFTARTVITGDPNISIEQIGVPYEIAMNLTYPERVTSLNIDRLQEMVDRGPSKYPGAAYVHTDAERRIDLLFANRKNIFPRLQIGYVVDRHLLDGDLVLFNRQPTLHRPSFMCHKVKVMRGKTFRMNLSTTTPYNADFDGDEMNVHCPQNLEAIAEMMVLSRVPEMVVSPQANKPVMGIVQDALCAVRKFTVRDVFLEKSMVHNLLMKLPCWDGKVPHPAVLKPVPLWTGKQLFSLLLPASLNYYGFHSTHPDDEESPASVGDTRVIIERGELLSGIICKKAVGTSDGSLIHLIWNDYGPEISRNFFDGCQYLVNEWLMHAGFSVGLEDCITSVETATQIKDIVDTAFTKVQCMLDEVSLAAKDPTSGHKEHAKARHLERDVSLVLSNARDTSGKTAATFLSNNNNFKQMVQSGSKGSAINISQITGIVGQQNVEGGRIPFGMRDRALPYFAKNDIGPEAKGFVRNSYLNGLKPTEFFFHAMGGREGLIDTACKTAETGYLQRKLVKALEDVTVTYDDTVRTAGGLILQFKYGEDGMDAIAIERQNLDLIGLSDSQVAQLSNIPEEVSQLLCDRDTLRAALPSLEKSIFIPINFRRLIKRVQDEQESSDDIRADRLWVFDTVTCFIDTLPKVYPLFATAIRYFFASGTLVGKMGFSTTSVSKALGILYKKFVTSRIDPGEAVGVIAAQSIGEPTTQLTLNTFHTAGISNQLVTSGVGRLKELINDNKNFSTPSMTIHLAPEYSRNKRMANVVAKSLRHVRLQDICFGCTVVHDPDIRNCSIASDVDLVETYWCMTCDDHIVPDKLSSYMLRLVVKRHMLLDLDLTVQDVCEIIEDSLDKDVVCYGSDDNDIELVIHVRFARDEVGQNDVTEMTFVQDIHKTFLDAVTINGIAEIETVAVHKRGVNFVKDDGGIGTRDEYYIETLGINMKAVICKWGIDRSRLYCNDPKEMLVTYGIEASRHCLLKEIRKVIEGSYVNYRHIALLCDLMVNLGQLMSVTRHGVNRLATGPIKKSTFEETLEVLMDAALNCEVDTLQGVSENIMLGRPIPSGTGAVSILYNDGMLDL